MTATVARLRSAARAAGRSHGNPYEMARVETPDEAWRGEVPDGVALYHFTGRNRGDA